MIWSVRTRDEFETLIAGSVVRTPNFALHRARLVDRDDPARVACAIAKSVGSAPTRNRLRRRLRAWAYHADLERGFGYFVRFRPTAARLRWRELEAEFDAALARFP